ncbi:MAG TPA: hypothetical protein VF865_04945 [Acidobacteriaceae bacterium]
MQVYLCRHIKTNGLQCRGAALSNSVFCYFHSRLHNSHELYRNKVHFQSAQIPHPRFLQLPAVEDRESAQLAISCVINALATGCITPKEANSLFYGLQLAAANARGLRIVRRPTQIVRDVYKEPWVSIPDASPDIAPPGRTCEIDDPATPAEIPVTTGAPGSTVSSSTLGLPPTETPAPVETHLPEEPAQPTTDNEQRTIGNEERSTAPEKPATHLIPLLSILHHLAQREEPTVTSAPALILTDIQAVSNNHQPTTSNPCLRSKTWGTRLGGVIRLGAPGWSDGVGATDNEWATDPTFSPILAAIQAVAAHTCPNLEPRTSNLEPPSIPFSNNIAATPYNKENDFDQSGLPASSCHVLLPG